MKKNSATGILIAGGKATRLGGRDKGLLMIDGEKCIERILAAMQNLVGEIIIIANSPAYDYLGLKVHADIIPGKGPAGGIYTGLHYSQTDDNLVAACDMPFVTSALLEFILSHRNSKHQAIIPSVDGALQPLCACYSKSMSDNLLHCINDGLYKMKTIITHFDFKELPVDETLPFFHPRLFANINTVDDFQSVTKTPAPHES